MSRTITIFIITLFCFCMSLESMERFFKSLQLGRKKIQTTVTTKKENDTFKDTLNLACQEHDFRTVAQLSPSSDKTRLLKKRANLVIQNYFSKKIELAETFEQLQEIHLEILNKMDFFDNTNEYEFLAHNIYNQYLILKEN